MTSHDSAIQEALRELVQMLTTVSMLTNHTSEWTSSKGLRFKLSVDADGDLVATYIGLASNIAVQLDATLN